MAVVTEHLPLGSAPQDSAAPNDPTELTSIAPDDPILAYLLAAPGAVDLARLTLDSPGLSALRAAGVTAVVPLVSQGELIGLLNLGPRMSDQGYSTEDLKLLDTLASHAAPALRVAQIMRDQEREAAERERYAAELRVAQLIQQNLLPRSTPDLPGWQVAAHYRPAREVGGDFYDFIELPHGRLGLVCGDVTDKGVPAALVMASTRSVLRAAAVRRDDPGEVLGLVNDEVCPDMPSKMFVTCLYAVLDPATGTVVYANAGHPIPYLCGPDGARELRARGMPLGLMPGSTYEQLEAVIGPGETLMLHSDGLGEAHGPDGDMFGFDRVRDVMARDGCAGAALIDSLVAELDDFTAPDWDQEDDITLVVLTRSPRTGSDPGSRELASFSVPSEPGGERVVMRRVLEAIEPLALPSDRTDRIGTAVAEAAMNAMEHGNRHDPDIPVDVHVAHDAYRLRITITDQGGDYDADLVETPDLEAKLAGDQTPRGWGLFLIRSMVDEVNTWAEGPEHTIELVVNLRGGDDGVRR